MFQLDLSDRVALVTGASRGIGAAITDALAQAGALVVGTATTPAGAERIAERLRERGARGDGRVLDVTDREGLKPLIDAVSAEFGAINLLVNNAGITRDNLLLRMSDADWDDVVDTNLGAVYRLSKLCARGMSKARDGRIINVGSVVGALGNAGQANYAAAKAGLAGLTRALARELASRQITVNTLAPGFIDTDMTSALGDAQRDALLRDIPLARLGAPADVAAAAVFLASSAATYVTGQTLHVNGGMFMGT